MNEKKTLSAVPPIAEPTDTSVVLNVYQRLSAIMDEVGVVGKEGFNPQQKFNFRGVDAVVNAVSPALRKHGVIVIPEASCHRFQSNDDALGSPQGEVHIHIDKRRTMGIRNRSE
jgi:hypothetical protein